MCCTYVCLHVNIHLYKIPTVNLYSVALPEKLKYCFKKYMYFRTELQITTCCKIPYDPWIIATLPKPKLCASECYNDNDVHLKDTFIALSCGNASPLGTFVVTLLKKKRFWHLHFFKNFQVAYCMIVNTYIQKANITYLLFFYW